MLSRYAALSVSLILKASPLQVICPSGLTRMTEDLSADFGSDEQQALKEKQATAHRTNEYVGGR